MARTASHGELSSAANSDTVTAMTSVAPDNHAFIYFLYLDTFLKPGITFEQLEQTALDMSDNEAAQCLNDARAQLFKSIYRRPPAAA